MCGIAGVLGSSAATPGLIEAMSDRLAHRGPDDRGVWHDREAGIALGHRRLAIVDLSSQGHQPMVSASGRFVLTFNGEIYNHRAIRAELDVIGAAPEGGWKGQSDTETLLQAIDRWGLDRTLVKAVGMFAIGLWDRQARRLSLARDRFGEKPLYYGQAGRDFLFASELKSFRRHPAFAAAIDRRAVRGFMARGYIAAPNSIYVGVFKLEPGTIVEVDGRAANAGRHAASGAATTKRSYWSYAGVVRDGLADPLTSEGEALEALEATLLQAVRDQSVADVPVGAFLSGGIDSSTIVALHQQLSSRPAHSFSIGFGEDGFDEAVHAREVARALGTDHHEHYVSVAEARDVIPLLPSIYDEPFADSSQIPTFLVSRFARRHVTVALTGDGGDELFAGYRRHFLAPAFWRRLAALPSPLRSFGGAMLGAIPVEAMAALGGARGRYLAAKVGRAARIAGSAGSFDDVYAAFLDQWHGDANPALGGAGLSASTGSDLGAASDEVRTMFADAVGYLPDDILCKVDRASMAVSLETRVPFLDHRVAAVAARIPMAMKIDRRGGKAILRKLLYRHAPKPLFDRPKAGFAVPVDEWLRGPLRDWAEDLLDPSRMRDEGYLDPDPVRRRWQAHLSGARDSIEAIWSVLMFQAWLREQGATAGPAPEA